MSGRFFELLEIVDWKEHGAGELGPLAGATHSRVVKTSPVLTLFGLYLMRKA